jgi:flagellin-like protein
MRGISPVIATVILVTIAVILALALVGPLSRMSKTSELTIRYQDSYIFIMGGEAHLVLSLSNNDGELTIDSITIETDKQGGSYTIDKNYLDEKRVPTTIPSQSDISLDINLGEVGKEGLSLGAKNLYKVIVKYKRSDGTTGIAVENVMFKG